MTILIKKIWSKIFKPLFRPKIEKKLFLIMESYVVSMSAVFYSFLSMDHCQIGKENDTKILKIFFGPRGYPGIPQIGKNCSKWLKTVFFIMLTYIFFINTNVVIS